MKFSAVLAFEKHLHASLSTECARSYLISCPSADERKNLIAGLEVELKKKQQDVEVFSYEARGDGFSQAILQLSTKPFFCSHVIVVLSEAQEVTKKQKPILEKYLLSPSSFATLILSSSTFKDLSDVYQKTKSELVVLDLSEEKPWDKQRRLQEWLIGKVLKEKKKISAAAVTQLFDSCGMDVALLEQELFKVITYIGRKELIELTDVLTIGSVYVLPTGWQLAEKLVWEEKKESKGEVNDIATLLPLIGQVRYHLQIGRQMAAYHELGKSREEIAKLLPQVRSSIFDKYMKVATKRPLQQFEEGLRHLFDIELLSKNSSLAPSLLWDLLASKLLPS